MKPIRNLLALALVGLFTTLSQANPPPTSGGATPAAQAPSTRADAHVTPASTPPTAHASTPAHPPAVGADAKAEAAKPPGLLPWLAGTLSAVALLLAACWHFSRTVMQNWTIGRRLSAGFGALLVALGGVSYLAVHGLVGAAEDFATYRDAARESLLMGRVHANFLEMRIAVKDFKVSRDPAELQHYEAGRKNVVELLAQAHKEVENPEELKTIEKTTTHLADYHATFERRIQALNQSNAAAEKELAHKMDGLGDNVAEDIEELKLEFIAEQNKLGPQITAKMAQARVEVMTIASGAVVLGLGLAFLIGRSLIGPVRMLADTLTSGAKQTADASGQVASASLALAEGASQQAASLEETSASLEEMTSMVKRNAESAIKAKTLAGETRAAADTGTTDMAEMKTAMAEIKASSAGIGKIIKTIDEIAFQTNILALNAAVEAARAGEAGMGFAVVADEVRNLAQRSALSAKETAEKIEAAIAKSERGGQISAKVAANFEEITTKARAVDQYVAEIAAASQEQAQGVAQVSLAVTQMDKVTQSNAASAEESSSAAEELNAQVESMLEAVGTLQKLVGSGTQASAASIPAPIHEAQGSRPAVRPATHTGARANTPSRANSNPTPTLQRSPLQASRRTTTEVANDDDDFKSF